MEHDNWFIFTLKINKSELQWHYFKLIEYKNNIENNYYV